MKRVLTFLAIMLLPLSVWAMTPVSDSDLSNVTGQAGVNINADLTMNIGIGTMAWGDSDGLSYYWTSPTTGGYVGVTGFNINNLRIKARETDHYGVGYGTVYSGSYGTVYLKPITIDVATGDKGTVAGHGAATTFVRFGLGSLQISLNELSFRVALGTAGNALTQEMGLATMGAIEIFINPSSYVDIYSHGASGVTMDLAITLDQFNMDYISWGDTDGLPGGNAGVAGGVGYWMAPGTSSTAGYVGLDSLKIGGPITITGTVAIDVVTSSVGVYAAHGTTTVCHISFPNLFNVNVAGPITADVKLDATAALNGAGAGTLGDIYISGFNLDILGGSWVDIWAH